MGLRFGRFFVFFQLPQQLRTCTPGRTASASESRIQMNSATFRSLFVAIFSGRLAIDSFIVLNIRGRLGTRCVRSFVALPEPLSIFAPPHRLLLRSVNPLTPMSDQDRISPYQINTISYGHVMRIKKNISLGIIN